MTTPLKIVVTNEKALRDKYSTSTKDVTDAVASLVAADAKRGLRTVLVRIDSAKDMKKYGAPVSSNRDRRGAKRAVDAICTRDTPDYLVLLGGPDVVPFQQLINPLRDEPEDGDRVIFSDLPYACDASYSTKTETFVGPSRVVGRIPDLQGASDPALIVALLDRAARWKSRPAADYADCFAISADIWRESTKKSLRAIYGKVRKFFRSPKSGPGWKKTQIAPRLHFINCHGGVADPNFYGEDKHKKQPCAHSSANLGTLVSEGSVVAAECCYGGELYDVATSTADPICTTYLREGAYAAFASTTVAYGEADTNTDADLICQYFLQAILRGASAGRAALEARQKFIETVGELDTTEVKTLGQFYLLGDPSVHPVASVAKTSKSKSVRTAGALASRAMAAISPMAAAGLATATTRRGELRDRGEKLSNETGAAEGTGRVETDTGVLAALREAASQYGEASGPILSFTIAQPPNRSRTKRRPMAAPAAETDVKYCVMSIARDATEGAAGAKSKGVAAAESVGGTSRRGPRNGVLLVAKVRNGTVLRCKRAFVH